MCSGIKSIIFAGWYNTSTFCFQDYLQTARDDQFRSSGYFTLHAVVLTRRHDARGRHRGAALYQPLEQEEGAPTPIG